MATAIPDLRHQASPRAPHLRKLWTLSVRGPGRSRRPVDLTATAAFAVGGVLLIWSAYIHFHLWNEPDGYRSIPTTVIGP